MSSRFLSSSQTQQAMRLANRSHLTRQAPAANRSTSQSDRTGLATQSSLKHHGINQVNSKHGASSQTTGNRTKAVIEPENLKQLRNLKENLNSNISSSLAPDELLKLKRVQEDKENQPPAAHKDSSAIKSATRSSFKLADEVGASQGVLLPSWAKQISPIADPSTRFGKIFQQAKKVADDQLKLNRESIAFKKRRPVSGELDSDGDIVPPTFIMNQNEHQKSIKTSSPRIYTNSQNQSSSSKVKEPESASKAPDKVTASKPIFHFNSRFKDKSPEPMDLLQDIPTTHKKPVLSSQKITKPTERRLISAEKPTQGLKDLLPSEQVKHGTESTHRLPFNISSFARSITASASKLPVSKSSNASTDQLNKAFLDGSKYSDYSHLSDRETSVKDILSSFSKANLAEGAQKDLYEQWSDATKKITDEGSQQLMGLEPSQRSKPNIPEQDEPRIQSMSVGKMRFTNTFQIARQIMNDTPIKSRSVVNQPMSLDQETNPLPTEFSVESDLPRFGVAEYSNQVVQQTPGFGNVTGQLQSEDQPPGSNDSNKSVFYSFGKGLVVGQPQPTPSFFFSEQPKQAIITPTFGEVSPFTYNPFKSNSRGKDEKIHREVTFGEEKSNSPSEISPIRQRLDGSLSEWVKEKTEDEDTLLLMLKSHQNRNSK
jgi:hypothetical protein